MAVTFARTSVTALTVRAVAPLSRDSRRATTVAGFRPVGTEPSLLTKGIELIYLHICQLQHQINTNTSAACWGKRTNKILEPFHSVRVADQRSCLVHDTGVTQKFDQRYRKSFLSMLFLSFPFEQHMRLFAMTFVYCLACRMRFAFCE